MTMTVVALLITSAVVASCVVLLRGVSALHRSADGGPAPTLDLMEAAFLNGGPSRAVDVALTTMYCDGRLAIGGPGIASARSAVAHDPVERAVLTGLAAAPNGALHHLRHAVMRDAAVQEIGDSLAFRGLMVPPGAGRGLRTGGTILALLCVVGLPFTGVAAGVAGFAGQPVGVFLALVLPSLLAGVICGSVGATRAGARVTPAGRAAATAYAVAYAYWTGPGHLVAVQGLRALPDPVLQDQLRTAARLTPGRPRTTGGVPSAGADQTSYAAAAMVWCAGSVSGHSSCGSSGDGGSGRGGSSCGSGSGSSCGSGSGSSCSSGSSSSSSCSSGSSSGSSCGSSS
ncbi:TIGR04222 domain-containing membrane protein [Streptomyces sp. NPDC054887]